MSLRAMWFWNSDKITDPTEVDKIISFATTHAITSVYTQINLDLGNAVFADFITQCTAAGIAVQALMGNKEWIQGRGEPSLDSQLDWLDVYQSNATNEARFSAIHMDVEPHALPDWEDNKAMYVPALQNILTRVKALGDSLGMKTGADMPWWCHLTKTPSGEALGAWTLNALDFVVFMTYRNSVDGLMTTSEEAVKAGDQVGKPVWLAVETNPVQEEGAGTISYAGMSQSKVISDMDCVATKLAGHASFAGIAIHDYTGILALAATGEEEISC
jgi:hypothetical protein